MEEIYSTGGKTFKLWYELPHQRENAIMQAQSMNNLNVESLAPTCPSAAKFIGETITLSSAPTSGTAPYTYTFWKTLDGINRTPVPSSGPSTTYTLTNSDLGNPTFGVTVTDSCPVASGGPKVAEEYCTISVLVPCGTPVANLTLA